MEATVNINEPEATAELPDKIENEPPVYFNTRFKLFLLTCWRGIVCVLTPLILIPMLSFPPEKHQWCAYTLALIAIYWVTECIPLPVTSFLPIVILPLTGVMNTTITCKCYMNDTIIMFLGSLALAYAVESSGLHKRLALCVIRSIGYSHYRLLFAMSFTTMFISMWITNTAATTMMVPINFALLAVLEDFMKKERTVNWLHLILPHVISALLLFPQLLKSKDQQLYVSLLPSKYYVIAFCVTLLGGIGTLVGSLTNLVFKGLFQRAYPGAEEYLSFPKFSAFTVPLMLGLQTCLYFNFLYTYFGFLRPHSEEAKKTLISAEGVLAAKNRVDEDWKNLGRITFWEIMAIILFVSGMIMFFSRSPQIFYGWGDMISDYYGLHYKKFVGDSAVAMLIVFLMLLLPSNLDFFKNLTANEDELPDKPIPSVLDWHVMDNKLPYGFMFLLVHKIHHSAYSTGAGFALSAAAKKEHSDFNDQIGIFLKKMDCLPNFMIILLIIIFTIFVTNFAANAVVANIVVPIVMQLAQEIGIHPLWYNIAAGLSASFCFCLPVGTPGNLVVQSAAKIPTIKMVKAGIGPTISTILLTWLAVYFYAPVTWPDLHYPISNSSFTE